MQKKKNTKQTGFT